MSSAKEREYHQVIVPILEGTKDPELRARGLAKLRDPMWTIPKYAKVKDFRGKENTADFSRIDDQLEEEVRAFCHELTDEEIERGEQTEWNVVVKRRQSARSTNFDIAGLALAMYRPGFDHVTIADNEPRAKYLHQRVHYAYRRWPKEVKVPTYSQKEKNQLTFRHQAICRTMSAQAASAGIGQTPDGFHFSECGFVERVDPSEVWSHIYPSLTERPNSHVVFECNPTENQSWWHDMYLSAKHRREDGTSVNRFRAWFLPFFKSNQCRRKWPKDQVPDLEELRLLDRYGPEGLLLEHLAFRREALASVDDIRRDPAKFAMFYPFDDVSCWMSRGRSAFPSTLLDAIMQRNGILVPWKAPYKVYEEYNNGCLYAITADPCGYAANDHAAFHVFKMNQRSEAQVACYADHTEPIAFSEALYAAGKAYGWALIVCERNGVGEATLSLLRRMKYPNLYWDPSEKPGWNNNPATIQSATAEVQDRISKWRLYDEDTIHQLQSYRHDKATRARVADIAVSSRRSRKKHHWDKVSALFGIVFAFRHRTWPSLASAKVDEAPTRVKRDDAGRQLALLSFDERREERATVKRWKKEDEVSSARLARRKMLKRITSGRRRKR